MITEPGLRKMEVSSSPRKHPPRFPANRLRCSWRLIAWALVCGAGLLVAPSAKSAAPSAPKAHVDLAPCHVKNIEEEVRCGEYQVFENRETHQGRKISLKIVVLPARHPHPEEGPVFFLAGGPGETATELAGYVKRMDDDEEHDVVLVDERGTGDGNRLDCRPPGSDDNLEGYLNGPFDPAAARACRDELEKKYDLTQYSTPNFVEDLDEVRSALAYDKINLSAGSFGTYAALIYMRRHPDHVRTAYLWSLTPLSDRVPLYFPQAAQHALDVLFDECEQDAPCQAAYPILRDDFAGIMIRLRAGPVVATVRHPTTGRPTEIHLSVRGFGDALRLLMYKSSTAYEIPFLIRQAVQGNFDPFAEVALQTNRNIYSGGRMGLYYAITCNEFVGRIKPEEIEAATRGTFLGAWRVRDQVEACKGWPKTELPTNYFKPFEIKVPVVIVSSEADPAGLYSRIHEAVNTMMPNAVEVILPGVGHPSDDDCTRSIRHALFRSGTTKNLNTSCVKQLRHPPFKLPSKEDRDR